MSAMRRMFGAYQILRRRAQEVGQPGLCVWTDVGTRAATVVRDTVRDESHAAECDDGEAMKLLEAALADGIDRRDTHCIRQALRHVRRSADHDHNLGEVAS